MLPPAVSSRRRRGLNVSLNKQTDELRPGVPSPGREPARPGNVPAGRPSGTQTAWTLHASGCHPGLTEGVSPAWETPRTWKTWVAQQVGEMTTGAGGIQATKDGLQLGGYEVLSPSKIIGSDCWGGQPGSKQGGEATNWPMATGSQPHLGT